jgi:hypothetical protein
MISYLTKKSYSEIRVRVRVCFEIYVSQNGYGHGHRKFYVSHYGHGYGHSDFLM